MGKRGPLLLPPALEIKGRIEAARDRA